MNIKIGLLTLGLVAAMSGCIDSGSDDTTDSGSGGDGGGGGPATVERISFSGLVADGYLTGATVCLDLNNNKECDDDEPSTTSGNGGAFEIIDATQEQRDTYPLLVEIVVGTTVDEDTITDAAPDGMTFEKPLTLTAPIGYEFISPLTTMVQNEVENGSTEAEAETAVQEKLGTMLDLDSDYIAGKASGANAEEYEQLHQVAQVTARVISENYDNLQSVADNNDDISIDDLISKIVDEVFEALDEITEQVEVIAADPDTEFDPDTVAQEVDEEVVDLDPDTVADDIGKDKAEEAAVGVDMSELLKSPGLTWFETDQDGGSFEAYYAAIYNDADGNFQEDELSWSGFTFNPVTDSGESDPAYILTDSGWLLIADYWTPDSITGFADGRIEIERAGGQVIERLISEEVILDGINTRITMNEVDDGESTWGNYLSPTATFPEDARGYILADNGSDETLVIEDWGECSPGEFGGFCNTVNLRTNNVFTQATSMDEVFVASAADLTGLTDFTSIANALTTIEIAYDDDDYQLQAEMVTNGTVNFYAVHHGDASYESLGSSTWSTYTKGSAVIYEIDVSTMDGFGDADNVLSVIAGYVRRTGNSDDDEVESKEIRLLNQIATDAVTGGNFSLDNLDLADRALCEAGNTVWDGLIESIPNQWSSVEDYQSAVESCWDGAFPMAVTDANFNNVILKSLDTGNVVANLANHTGVSISGNGEKFWFTWEVVDESFAFSAKINKGDGTFVTITSRSENVIVNPIKNYIQSKWMTQNSDVTAAYGDKVFIYSDAFEVKGTVNDSSDPTPAEAFDPDTLPGTYTWIVDEGVATFIIAENLTGTIHWPAEVGDTESPDGYDDTITWSIDTEGRLLIAITTEEGEFQGVERFTITSGTFEDGVVMAEGINQFGEFSPLASFAWVRVGDTSTVACTIGDVEWDAGTDPTGATLKSGADYDAAVLACLGTDAKLPVFMSRIVGTTFTSSDGDYVYTFNEYSAGVDAVNPLPLETAVGTLVSPDGEFNFSWRMERVVDVDPSHQDDDDLTGVTALIYDDGSHEFISLIAHDGANTASYKGRTVFETDFPGLDKGDIWSGVYVQSVQTRTTLTELAAAGIFDESRLDGTRNTYWEFVDNGSDPGEFKVYERAEGAACYTLDNFPFTDFGNGFFLADVGGGEFFQAAWQIGTDNRIYIEGSSHPLAEDQSIISTITASLMCTP